MDKKLKVLQIGNTDLVGNKFNGHDLSIYLQECGIDAKHLVVKKLSKSENTYTFSEKGVKNFAYPIIKDKLFLEADIVHLHLIQCTTFDINLLPFLTALKPTVITLHDGYYFSGHCIHSFGCDKWKSFCFDCPKLNIPVKFSYDATSYYFLNRKLSIQNSRIAAIVASDYMENNAKQSPIWAGKKIYKLPFGINQEIFKPSDKACAKRKLGIDENSLVIMFRSTTNEFKGIDLIKDALLKLKGNKNITLLGVEEKGNLKEFQGKFKIKEYGWIYDDNKLAEMYQAADLFLMPSRQEAFGMMAIEAMSSGVPVLSIKGTALESVTNSPECGLCVEESEFASALQNLVDSPSEIKQRADKSLQYALANYNKDIYVQKMIEIYYDVIKNHNQTQEEKITLEQMKKYGPKYTRAINRVGKFDRIYSRKNVGDKEVITVLGLKITRKCKPKKNKFNPLVSIVIPVYNGENFVKQAIKSALSQTYKNTEIIVVNDGSVDNTEKIVKKFGNRVRYFKKENGGVSTALNLAIEEAKGEYISWLSHDDLYMSDKIEKQIEVLSRLDNKDTILYSNYQLINKKGKNISATSFQKEHSADKLAYQLFPILNGLIHGCTLLIPKKCFVEQGFFDEKLRCTQDYDLWFKMFPKYEIRFMQDILIKSRVHADQDSKKHPDNIKECDKLWINMFTELTEEEILKMNNSVEEFYKSKMQLLHCAKYFGAEEFVKEKLSALSALQNK